jgi:isoleucyl-tRNA synthetase
MAPVLSFTTDEAWSFLKKRAGAPASVHLTLFPEAADLSQGLDAADRQRLSNWGRLMEVRETVLRNLEISRQQKVIGASLEATVHLKAGNGILPLLEQYSAELPALFIVSQVSLEGHADADVSVHVERSSGTKCERCWKYLTSVGSVSQYPTICKPCAEAVEQIAEEGPA